MSNKTMPRPGLALELLPIALTFLVLGVQQFVFDTFTPHVPLIIGIGITAIVGLKETLHKSRRSCLLTTGGVESNHLATV